MDQNEKSRFPDMPARIKRLRVDHRGYPVPYFVAWINGRPDHRVVDGSKLWPAMNDRRCWICGQRLGANLAFALGPMCVITRATGEPPSHRDCAEFAVKTCPFLTIPAKDRRYKNLPDTIVAPAGNHSMRNPGAIALWVTKSYESYVVDNGVLIRVGDPLSVDWYCEGRAATAEEVAASMAAGLPRLIQEAEKDGPVALGLLRANIGIAAKLMPAWGSPMASESGNDA